MGSFASIGSSFVLPPALAVWGEDNGFLFVLAVGSDQALWSRQLGQGRLDDGAPWGEWTPLGGFVTSQPCAVQSQQTKVDVFATGRESELLHWHADSGEWVARPFVNELAAARVSVERPPVFEQYWSSLGGILVARPSATVFGELNDEILVFGVGTDHALWVRAFAGGSWQPWTSFGHELASAPSAVTFRNETWAVAARGTDSAIWVLMDEQWRSLGGRFSSAPVAIASLQHIRVFATADDSTLQVCTFDGNSWSGWESLGGILFSAPAVNADGDLQHVFGVGADSAIWRRIWDGSEWTDWHRLDGIYLSEPATIGRSINGTTTRDVAALGFDHQIWHMEEDDIP